MSPNWPAVVVSTGAVLFGLLLFVKAAPITAFQRRLGARIGKSERQMRNTTVLTARLGGIGFIVIGLLGAAMGLFLGDKM